MVRDIFNMANSSETFTSICNKRIGFSPFTYEVNKIVEPDGYDEDVSLV